MEWVISTYRFWGDFVVAGDVSVRYRPLGASRDVLFGTGATYHHPGMLVEYRIGGSGRCLGHEGAKQGNQQGVTADLAADLRKHNETKEATTKKRLFD